MTKLIDRKRYMKFKEDVDVFNLEKEYPGYTGTEKYLLLTDVPENVLESRFPEEMERFSPYIICERKMMEHIVCFHMNEDKHRKRNEKAEEIRVEKINHGIEFEEPSHPSFIEEVEIMETEEKWKESVELTFRERFSMLSDVQKKRIIMKSNGMSLEEIGEVDQVSAQAVKKSIDHAKKVIGTDFYKKIRKNFA